MKITQDKQTDTVDVGLPKFVKVVIDRKLREPLDYLPMAGRSALDLPVGTRVRVPLGRSETIGVVIDHAANSAIDVARLKPVRELLDASPIIDTDLLALLRWTADYYHHPLGEIIFSALPAALRIGAPATAMQQALTLTTAGHEALTSQAVARAPRQRELLEALQRAGGRALAQQLDTTAKGWRTAARALIERGWMTSTMQTAASHPLADAPSANALAPNATQTPVLTAPQMHAIAAITSASGRFAPMVLQGVTGSGKTEVYLQAVAATLSRGESALVLVPEIGLTPQLVGRFRERFALPIAVLHSGMSDGERLAAWRLARSGSAPIVIGTRSAVFAPLATLGLIIVDEEHDSSFKQQEGGCRYSARDIAVQRAHLRSLPIVLGSATPALETLHNVQRGRYQRLLLPRRDDQAPAPRLALIDLRAEAVTAGISGTVMRAIERHLAAGSQVLVYINRRGYAPTLLCTACGWIAPCEHCDARLTVHHHARQLRCHVCGADHPLPERCARCGFTVKPVGHGTERVEATLMELFPNVALARLDRDVAHNTTQLEAVMQQVHSGTARILVGTQMVTKGHHFPEVTLVVVLNADQGLFSTDFRAAERLAQTIVQVAGRAGRESRPGEVLIQTEYPEHPLLQSLLNGGYETFAVSALEERAAARWPPYAYIALLRASAPDASQAQRFLSEARVIGERVGQQLPIRLLGPVDASMARRAGRHHAQLLVEGAARGALQAFLSTWVPAIEQLPDAARVRWALDVDPLDTQ